VRYLGRKLLLKVRRGQPVACDEKKRDARPAEGSMLGGLFVRRTSQRGTETVVRRLETTMGFVYVQELGTVDLIQRRLYRLNFEHAVSKDFTFELV
jgi:hypothetical protein